MSTCVRNCAAWPMSRKNTPSAAINQARPTTNRTNGSMITGSQSANQERPGPANAIPNVTRMIDTRKWKIDAPTPATGRISRGNTTFFHEIWLGHDDQRAHSDHLRDQLKDGQTNKEPQRKIDRGLVCQHPKTPAEDVAEHKGIQAQ